MQSRRARKNAMQSPQRGAQSIALGAMPSRPSSDALLLIGAALLALSVFELAAWLAAAPLTTLVYSVALVPLALFATALVSAREP
jgi:VIT1/CCC1 family predicted Fe2+/Mn2+ transporter